MARNLIEENQDKMHAMAKAMLEWETIDSDQLDDIMAGKPPRPPKDWTPRTPSSAVTAPGGTPALRQIQHRPWPERPGEYGAWCPVFGLFDSCT